MKKVYVLVFGLLALQSGLTAAQETGTRLTAGDVETITHPMAAEQTAIAGASPNGAPAVQAQDSPFDYVSFGDSYSSGEGAYDYFSGTDVTDVNLCHRSKNAYSTQTAGVFSEDEPVQRLFFACSGAITENLVSWGQWNEDPQIQLLRDSGVTPEKISLTIGGNDTYFADVLRWCAAEKDCRVHKPFAGSAITLESFLTQRLPLVQGFVENTLAELDEPSVLLTLATRDMTLHNDGNAALNITTVAYPTPVFFGPSLAASMIPAKGSVTAPVNFLPPDEGAFSGTIMVNSDMTSGVDTNAVSGNGVAILLDPPGAAAATFYPQQGVWRQTVTVVNTYTQAIAAVRVRLWDLPAGAFLYNPSGVDAAGVPYAQVNATLDPGESTSMQLLIASATRPAHTLTAHNGAPKDPTPEAGAAPASVQIAIPAPEHVLLEFWTHPGGRYQVQYSTDMVGWKAAGLLITATGDRIQWVDHGPPATESPPTGAGRFYRVIELP